MTTGEDGNLLVNKKNYGKETSDIEELIAHLGEKRAGWPVPLTKPCSARCSCVCCTVLYLRIDQC
jgi:hypothetical protein